MADMREPEMVAAVEQRIGVDEEQQAESDRGLNGSSNCGVSGEHLLSIKPPHLQCEQ
jgi:hypothetical protein